ncbi:MAG: hypothetical protein ACRD6Q_00415 [Nitrososphaeraceae archaeon]
MLLTEGFAQKQEIDSDNLVYAQDTFSAIGQISSLVITVPESNFNITNIFKVILKDNIVYLTNTILDISKANRYVKYNI